MIDNSMKIFFQRNMILTAALLLFTSAADYAYSEALPEKPDVLLLQDRTQNYPVLKGLFDDGFFAEDNLNVSYIPFTAKETGRGSDFLLTSALINSGGNENALFSLAVTDSLNQNLTIEWEATEDGGRLQSISLQGMINLAKGIRESSVPDAMVGTKGIAEMVTDMNVWYLDEKDETSIGGYNITFDTGFSPAHRFARTLIEITLMNSIGVANYWINKDDNMEDWRYKYRWKDVGPRLLDGWSYDTNAFRTNSIYHFYAGAIYYQAARSNEYGFLASTAWSFAGSFIWEYIGEWREQTSANDMVFTPFGGSLLGEALYQSSIYIENCMPHSVYGKIFACLLDPMRILNRGIDSCFNNSFKVKIVFVNPAVQALMDIRNKNK